VIKKILLILFIATSSTLLAQRDNFWLYGKVKDSSGVVKNANILNLKTDKGTFSNDFGDYKIIVSIGDTLKFTSVQHKTVIRVINNFIYTSEVLDVYMIDKTVVLDEVVVKKHDLDGYLLLDRKRTPEDRKAEALKRVMDFSKVDMKVQYDGDFIDQRVRPPIETVDPTAFFVGAGATVTMPFKYSERLWALRRKMEFQKSLPYKLISEFGEPFFENNLKIPKERYFHFLEYCNPLGIENLYKRGRKIEVINILRKESVSYLKLIAQEKEE
jgi:hypothetical protein